MERSEPALVPEWLRCTGSVTGGGTSTHPFASSLQSDVSSSFPTRNRCSRSNSEKDAQRPAFLDRSFSSNSRRSSGSSGSAKHPYGSFTRSHRDRNREKDKERSITGDLWDHDSSDSLDNILTSSVEKSSLRRSQSLAHRRTGEVLSRKTEDSRNGANINQNNGNGSLLGGSNLSGFQKAAFDKDFPSLGTEEKPGTSGLGRVSSPVLTTAVQSLPIGNSGLLGGEKWTSALAEVPAIIGSNSMINSSAPQNANSSPSSNASSVMANLNMAEALSQAPPYTRTAPQVPEKGQRLDELTMKQCRQLIPRAPSMPKALVPSVSEKLKQSKAGARVNEPIIASRSMQQLPQLANQPRGGQLRSDAPNTSHAGKFLVLKPARENGAISAAKDASSPTNNGNGKLANGQHTVTSLTPTALMNPSNPKAPILEKKAAALTLNHKPVAEKKSTLSQAQSRSDFFNLMRKKTLLNASSNASDSSPDISSCAEKSDENRKEAESAPEGLCVTEKLDQMLTNGYSHGHPDKGQGFPDIGEKNMSNGGVFPYEEPDEEEAAFLRSLGWKENGEVEVITEEEINAFYEEYMNLRPSLKVWRGIRRPKFGMLSGSHSSNSVAAASESRSAGLESEA